MGADARGRRHATRLAAGRRAKPRGNPRAQRMPRGQKLVVQMVETFREHMQPAFVERLDAWTLAESGAACRLPPVMIYGDDVTHVLTEEGIANLLMCRNEPGSASRRSAASPATRRSASARDRRAVENLRDAA